MADAIAMRRAPVEDIAAFDGPRSLSLLPPMTRLNFRGRISTVGRVAAAFGVEPAMEPCRAATNGERAALWLGPDEWLLLARDGEAAALIELLDKALDPLPHSLVDVSHRHTGLKLAGEHAALILNAGCPLNLSPNAFPVGMCTRTLLEKSEIVLWRIEENAFHIEVARSFVPYVVRFLGQAERDV